MSMFILVVAIGLLLGLGGRRLLVRLHKLELATQFNGGNRAGFFKEGGRFPLPFKALNMVGNGEAFVCQGNHVMGTVEVPATRIARFENLPDSELGV